MSNELATRTHVLIVEDDPEIAEVLSFNLERFGFETSIASDGEAGVRAATSRQPDIILLDLMLPKLDGVDVIRALQSDSDTAAIPILVLSARGDETDVVLGLGVGASDYMVKPFRVREVVARIKAILRRHRPTDPDANPPLVRCGPLTLDMESYCALVDEEDIRLTLTEFKILTTLASRPGRVFSRDELHGDWSSDLRVVDVHIASIRKKLAPHQRMLATVRGVGYKLVEEK